MPHMIEVDDEIMALLKDRAEAFVDTPNSVLRRLLLAESVSPRQSRKDPGLGSQTSGLIPRVKRGTPKALEQILQVAYLVQNSSRTRTEATHLVANHHGVAFQTVLDKYCRQLDLTADGFDDLLAEPELPRLRRLLVNRFDKYREQVEDVLG